MDLTLSMEIIGVKGGFIYFKYTVGETVRQTITRGFLVVFSNLTHPTKRLITTELSSRLGDESSLKK